MSQHYQQFVKLINKQIKQYLVFYNTKGFVKNITEKVRSKSSNIQNNSVEKYNILTKKLYNKTSIMQDLNVKTLELSTPLPRKLVKWWQWYHQLTGLDMVEAAKKQVIVLQDKLFQCQNNRMTLNKQMTDVTHRLQEVYGELIQTKRDDPKYVHLTIIENKSLQEQNKIINQLTLLEKEERDNFTQLSTAIKEYHDSQNLNAQKYKYLSILASALITIISLISSMILNNRRILDVRCTISKAQEKNESLLNTNANQLTDLLKMMHSFETKFFQNITNTDKEKKTEKENNTSNVLLTSTKHTAHIIVSGVNYIKKGIYACGSYIKKIF